MSTDTPANLTLYLRQFGLFIGWLSGALVGVTGLLYALGYVAATASTRFLGLGPSRFDDNPLKYLATGADASIYIALDFGVTLFSMSLIVFVVPIGGAIRKLVNGRFSLSPDCMIGRFVNTFISRRTYGWRIFFYALLFIYVFFWFYDRYVQNVSVLLSISNILHDPDPITGLSEGDLRRRILCAPDDVSRSCFAQLIIASGVALVLTGLAWRAAAGMASHQLLIAPFAILLVSLAYLLSSTYGILLLGKSFSPVELVEKQGGIQNGAYLIDRNSTYLVLWDPVKWDVVWIREDAIAEVRIGKPERLIDIHAGLARGCRQPG